MEIHATSDGHKNIFTGYDAHTVSVDSVAYHDNLILLPTRLITGWTRAQFTDLSSADFALLAELDVELILLGTGVQQHFPRPELWQSLLAKSIALEVMTTQAACRTFNMLRIEENRNVAAALLLP